MIREHLVKKGQHSPSNSSSLLVHVSVPESTHPTYYAGLDCDVESRSSIHYNKQATVIPTQVLAALVITAVKVLGEIHWKTTGENYIMSQIGNFRVFLNLESASRPHPVYGITSKLKLTTLGLRFFKKSFSFFSLHFGL